MHLKLTNKISRTSAKPALFALVLFIIPFVSGAQQIAEPQFVPGRATICSDSICLDTIMPAAKPNRGRVILMAGVNAFLYTGSLVGLKESWYEGYPRKNFHTFNDSREWLQVDKVGHAWSAYSLGKYSTDVWKWAGLPHKKAVWIGGLSGTVYLTAIELLDAHSARWGWSWADMGANILGSGLFISQALAWDEQRIQFKFSFHKKSYEDQLIIRTNELFGSNLAARTLKDYNGQTYWLSVNLKSFFRESHMPAWLNIAGGYGAEGMLGGFENKWTSRDGGVHTRYDIPRRRQFYIAPDIDLTKIKTNKKGIRTVLNLLNAIKFPAPALEFSDGKIKGHWLYF